MLTAPDAARGNRPAETRPVVAIVGKESVGKTQLASALSGRPPRSQNFRGSTVSVERFRMGERDLVDTPGILRRSDTETTRLALAELAGRDEALLVVQATHIDDDLRDLLPLVQGKRGAIVITFWDKVARETTAVEAIARIERECGVPVVPVDARRLTEDDKRRIAEAMVEQRSFTPPRSTTLAGWRIEPRPGILERPWLGPLTALLLLAVPAAMTILFANEFAGWCHPIVEGWMAPLVTAASGWSPALQAVLIGRGDVKYGLLTMGPFLFVWAMPTVLLYAVVLGGYKASGLVERISGSLEKLTRPFGLTGRDVVRVLIGLGCNVPAVISTRSCSRCSRGPAMAAIAFGAACSYQLPATIAVFSAAGRPWLAVPFLLYLAATTLVYLRLTTPAAVRSPIDQLLVHRRTFLVVPEFGALWREARGTLTQFFFTALPIFFAICVAASLLEAAGAIHALSRVLEPAMAAFGLPASATVPIVFASIRKDGLLLLMNGDSGVLPGIESARQLLTAVYLGGVLAPCLVTALTIAREESLRFAALLMLRQAFFAALFALAIAWFPWPL